MEAGSLKHAGLFVLFLFLLLSVSPLPPSSSENWYWQLHSHVQIGQYFVNCRARSNMSCSMLQLLGPPQSKAACWACVAAHLSPSPITRELVHARWSFSYSYLLFSWTVIINQKVSLIVADQVNSSAGDSFKRNDNYRRINPTTSSWKCLDGSSGFGQGSWLSIVSCRWMAFPLYHHTKWLL